MSRLIVAFFKDPNTAKNARAFVKGRHQKHLVDAVAVVRSKDGALSVHQTKDHIGREVPYGLVLGAIAGILFGWLMWFPVAGLILGALGGAGLGVLAGMLTDYGIDDHLIERLGSYLKPETSALFLLYNSAVPKPVLQKLDQAQAVVIHTPLNNQAEEALRLKLKKLQQTVPPKSLPVYTVDFNRGRPEGRHSHA